jgi:hypothetical protein
MSVAGNHRSARFSSGGEQFSCRALNWPVRNPSLLCRLTRAQPGQSPDRFSQEAIEFSTYAYNRNKQTARAGYGIVGF